MEFLDPSYSIRWHSKIRRAGWNHHSGSLLNITKEITVRGQHAADASDRFCHLWILRYEKDKRRPVNTDTGEYSSAFERESSRPNCRGVAHMNGIDEACDASREIYLLGIVLKSMSQSKLSEVYWLHQRLKDRAFWICTFGSRRLLSTDSCDERRFSWQGLLSMTQNRQCLLFFYCLSVNFCLFAFLLTRGNQNAQI